LIALLLAALFAAAGCSSTPPPEPPATQAMTRFQEGEKFFEDGLYTDAISAWEKVRESYYSPELNALVELKIAEAYFLDGKYLEAAAAYEAFLNNHPGHPREEEVLFQLGLANVRQMLDKDQDQTMTRQAMKAFETLLVRFPQTPRRAEVTGYTDYCRNQLAANEVVVGRFYLKTGKYQAAISRLTGVLSTYPAYPEEAEVYYHLGQAYLLNGDRTKADAVFSALYDRYPYSDYVIQAEEFLRKNN
jgi:outer membrane protein assembly factor BamD